MRQATLPRFHEAMEMGHGWWRSSTVGAERDPPPRRRLTDSEDDKDGSLSRFEALLPYTPLLLP